ncbi:hypothetical protein ABIC55_003575 [Sporosarcina psychrophila]|uniref:Uncharacterized protein n=1 Tax=Sporosarcina psychrophila TaxID=1476 RepID=A0ABV2KEQ0_SPOPS
MTEYGQWVYGIASAIVIGVMFAAMWREVGRTAESEVDGE